MELRGTGAKRRWVVGAAVDAPAERVWELLVDTERWPEWGPTVTAVESPTRCIEEGTTGHVRVRGIGVRVPFEIRGFDADGMRWRWNVAGVPATGHRVAASGNGCRVELEIPLAAAGYAPVCRLACRRIKRLAEA